MTDATRIRSEDFARFVRQLYRLFKIGSFHLLNNEAVSQTVEQSVAVFRELAHEGFERLSVLLLADTVFVNGTLLKAKRDVYESTQELAALLIRAGYNQVTLDTSASPADLHAVLANLAYRIGEADPSGARPLPPPMPTSVHLSLIDPEMLADLMATELDERDRTGRTYASALVLMRYQFDALKRGEYVVAKPLKRLAQQLVALGHPQNPAFIGVTRLRGEFDDEAGRAVHTAIVAVATARQLTEDLRILSRIAMTALLIDVGIPRAAGMGRDGQPSLPVIPRLNEHERATVPASTAAVFAQLGGLFDESLQRMVCGFEAQALHQSPGEPLPYAPAAPRVDAEIVWLARAFNAALGFDIRQQRHATPDEAIARLSALPRTSRQVDVLALLFRAVGLLAAGTIVQLADRSTAVVLRNAAEPGRYGLPTLLRYLDAHGVEVAPHELDLAYPSEQVLRHGGIIRILDDATLPPSIALRVGAQPTRPLADPEPSAAPEAPRAVAAPPAADAERELERLLGEYFDPTTKNPPALGVRADHTLPPVGTEAAKAAAPVIVATAPHPATVTLDSTQDLRENSARDLLAQFFPDVPAASSGEHLAATHQIATVPASDAEPPTLPPRIAAPLRPSVAEDTTEVSAQDSQALLARFREDDDTPDSVPLAPSARPSRLAAPPRVEVDSESTQVTADPRADALLRRYLDDAPDEADPLGFERARARAAAPSTQANTAQTVPAQANTKPTAPESAKEDPTEALLRAYLNDDDA